MNFKPKPSENSPTLAFGTEAKLLTVGLKPGERIGPFTIVRMLGQGGMGTVYLAEQDEPKRNVALKLMTKLSTKDKSQEQRFLREAELSSRLDHPNIVKIFSASLEERVPYMAMTYLEGMELSDYVKTRNPGLREKLLLFQTIAEALHYAHREGIVHRDIKPGNIMVKNEGTPVLMDFGIAKNIKIADRRLTKTGEIIGTPAYMSPEQARGVRALDAQSDVYSLGAVCYEAITGHPLYDGTTEMEILYQLVSSSPRLPSQIVPDLPAEVEAILLKSIEKSRQKRYKNAGEMALDIQRYLEGKKIHSRSVHAMSKVARRVRSSGKKTAIVFLCLFLLASLGALLSRIVSLKKGPVFSLSGKEKSMDETWTRLGKSPSAGLYRALLDSLLEEGFTGLAFEKSEEAIGWARKNDPKSAEEFERYKCLASMRQGEFEGPYEIYRKWNSSREDFAIRMPLVQCSFELGRYEEVLRLCEKMESQGYPQECFFYHGAALFRHFLASVAKHDSPVLKAHSQNAAHPFLQQAFARLQKSAGTEKKQGNRQSLYLGSVALWQGRFEIAGKMLSLVSPENLGRQDALLFHESQGFLVFHEKKYERANDCFSQCIRLCPWESRYYFYRACCRIEQEGSPFVPIIEDLTRSMHLSSPNLLPLERLLEDISRNRRPEEIFYQLFLFADYMKWMEKTESQEMWADQYTSMAQGFFSFSPPDKESDISPETADYLVHKMAHTPSDYGFQSTRETVSRIGHHPEIRKAIERFLRNPPVGYSLVLQQQAKKRVEEIRFSIEKKEKQRRETRFKADMARLIVGKEPSALLSLRTTWKEISESVLYSPKEPALLRYWVATMLVRLRLPEAHKMLEKGCLSEDMVVKLSCICALSAAGFDAYKHVKDMFVTDRNDVPPELLAIFFERFGPSVGRERCLAFSKHPDEKVRLASAVALLEHREGAAIPLLIGHLESRDHEVRAYALYHLSSCESAEMRQKLISAGYFEKLEKALKDDPSPRARRWAAKAAGKSAWLKKEGESSQTAERLTALLKEKVGVETEEGVRFEMAMALIELGFLHAVLEYTFHYQQRFSLRAIPLFRMFMDLHLFGKQQNQQETIKFAMSYNLEQDPDRYFKNLYLFYLCSIGHLSDIPPWARKTFILPILKKGIESPDLFTRQGASHVSALLQDPDFSVRAFLKERFLKEENVKIREFLMSALTHFLFRDLHEHQKIALNPKAEHAFIRQQMDRYPKAKAYGLYHFIETIYKGAPFRHVLSENLWPQEAHYLIHLDTTVHKIVRDITREFHAPKAIADVPPSFPERIVEEAKEAGCENLSRLARAVSKINQKYVTPQEWATLEKSPLEKYTPKELEILYRFHVARRIFQLTHHLKSAVQLDPEQSRYAFELAFLYEAIGELELAWTYLEKALSRQPGRISYRMSRIRLLFKRRQLAEARNYIEKLVAEGNPFYEMIELQGHIYMACEEWAKARDAFDRLSFFAPHLGDSLVYRGNARLSLGDESAKSDFEAALPRLVRERDETKKMYGQQDDFGYFNYRRYNKTAFMHYYLGMARLAARANNPKEALLHLQKGIELSAIWQGSYESSPFTRKSLQQYPELLPLLSESAIQSLPFEIIGFLEKE